MTPHSQYKRIALYSIVQDEDGYVIKNDLCLCEHCKVNGFLCPRHPVAEPCASHSSAPSEQSIRQDEREKVLDELNELVKEDLKQDFNEENYITYQDFLWCLSELRKQEQP